MVWTEIVAAAISGKSRKVGWLLASLIAVCVFVLIREEENYLRNLAMYTEAKETTGPIHTGVQGTGKEYGLSFD